MPHSSAIAVTIPMVTTIQGPIFKIPKKDVDTDQIIPARYLTKSDKSGFGPFVMEGLEFEGFDRNSPAFKQAKILIVGENFGCGSSREHAVWAIQAHGIQAIIGTTFARIFYQNSIACGLPIIQVSSEDIKKLFSLENGTEIQIDLEKKIIQAGEDQIPFALDEYDQALLRDGGLVGFAYKRYVKGTNN
jgi:3-isopropylmalate/(R)-2-methylmalate dehydratase small subunit